MIGGLLPRFIFEANEFQFRLVTEGTESQDNISEANNDDNFSLQNYPMDGHRTVTLG